LYDRPYPCNLPNKPENLSIGKIEQLLPPKTPGA
jgi:hypothetical protein